MTLTRIKSKTCKVCRSKFEPRQPMATVCSPGCALTLAQSKRAKAEKVAQVKERKADRAKLDALKSKSTLAREAQHAFNAWVRLRDAGRPCISCGRHHQGQMHAGHYLSRGSHPELAYEPMNCWLQCAPCNTYLSGNQAQYRKALLCTIGQENLEWLEGPHAPKRHTHEQLRGIKAHFNGLARELKKAAAHG